MPLMAALFCRDLIFWRRPFTDLCRIVRVMIVQILADKLTNYLRRGEILGGT